LDDTHGLILAQLIQYSKIAVVSLPV
jgi:hypothetical protein